MLKILRARERGESGIDEKWESPDLKKEVIIFDEPNEPYTDENLPFQDYVKLFSQTQELASSALT